MRALSHTPSAVSVDITSFITAQGEGLGDTLTLMLSRGGGGNRGYLNVVGTDTMTSLTLTTVPVPEPASLALLTAGGLLALIRRKK